MSPALEVRAPKLSRGAHRKSMEDLLRGELTPHHTPKSFLNLEKLSQYILLREVPVFASASVFRRLLSNICAVRAVRRTGQRRHNERKTKTADSVGIHEERKEHFTGQACPGKKDRDARVNHIHIRSRSLEIRGIRNTSVDGDMKVVSGILSQQIARGFPAREKLAQQTTRVSRGKRRIKNTFAPHSTFVRYPD
ncbi:hypothetical protein NPIL_45341 [Nephila pilipes]|uniref:Uncharacterized protein n=1 Tax=Nephila pilipes TaxID=299642 RepID=A0A8X6P219_NEPPI|nr:hypothetical protein NPIL_45341 [Nephila pilipes]